MTAKKEDAAPVSTEPLASDEAKRSSSDLKKLLQYVVDDQNHPDGEEGIESTDVPSPSQRAPPASCDTSNNGARPNQESSNRVEVDEEVGGSEDHSHAAGTHLVDATVVAENDQADRTQMEREIRDSILKDTLEANVISEERAPLKSNEQHWPKATGMLLVLAVVGVALGLAFGLTNGRDANEDQVDAAVEVKGTLAIVQERGFVKCGMNDLSFSKKVNPEVSDKLEGFNVEHCRAIALMALGDADKFEQVWVNIATRFELLADKTIDVITEGTTFTMGRDVLESHTNSAFSFTTPYFYAGLMFAGIPKYVDCADALEDFYGDCRDLSICTADGSTHHRILLDILDGGVIVPNDSVESMRANIQSGICNVVAAEQMFLLETRAMFGGDEWIMGKKSFSKEPLSHVTRQDDAEWSMLVDMVVKTFILAEAHGISKDNAYEIANFAASAELDEHELAVWTMDRTKTSLASLMVALISEFGNHGDIYEQYIEAIIPRGHGVNSVYDASESSGLLLSFPMGYTDGTSFAQGPGPLNTFLQQDTLVCGVVGSRGPAYAAFDEQFCNGIAASLFGPDTQKITFLDLQDMDDAYNALVSGGVDVVAGARVTLQAQYHESATGKSFSFSTPYYYNNESHEAFCLMTMQDNVQWSDLVNWIVLGVIYAEENGISATDSTKMPLVRLFGEEHKAMFWNCISAVGNYGELYNSTLQEFVPRSGANTLNTGSGPQLFPVPIN